MVTKQNNTHPTNQKKEQDIGRLLFKAEQSQKMEQYQSTTTNLPQLPKYAWR